MSRIENWDETIPLWRTHYGIVKGDPDAAYFNWKRRTGHFGAPVGTLTALSHCLEEIDRLRTLCREAADRMPELDPSNPSECDELVDWVERLRAAGSGKDGE